MRCLLLMSHCCCVILSRLISCTHGLTNWCFELHWLLKQALPRWWDNLATRIYDCGCRCFCVHAARVVRAILPHYLCWYFFLNEATVVNLMSLFSLSIKTTFQVWIKLPRLFPTSPSLRLSSIERWSLFIEHSVSKLRVNSSSRNYFQARWSIYINLGMYSL